MINGNGAILGILSVAAEAKQRHRTTREVIDALPTNIAWAVKAAPIKTALKFEKWVGSETVPVEGQVVNPNQTSTIRGWAYDPLNPSATLKVEMYAGGKKGTGKKVGSTLMASLSQEGADIEDISGAGPAREGHGFRVGRIPPQYSRSPFYVYALQPDSSPEKWELLDGSGVRPWPDDNTSQTIDPRKGNAQRIELSMDNDTPPPSTVNFPVHPNAKAAVEAILEAVHKSNTTPAITSININSTVREKDLRREKEGKDQSSHVSGRGVDINRINGKAARCAHMDFRRDSRCIMLNNDQILDLKNQVKALQKAFLKDCRVEEVFGPVLNEDKATGWVGPKTKRRHRNHIHITVWEMGQSTCTK